MEDKAVLLEEPEETCVYTRALDLQFYFVPRGPRLPRTVGHVHITLFPILPVSVQVTLRIILT